MLKDFDARVGREIRRWRKARKMSQSELGALTHLSQQMIAAMELGNRPIKVCYLISIANALSVHPATLLPVDIRITLLPAEEPLAAQK